MLKEIPVTELNLNPTTVLANDWMLVSAGSEKDGFNTMTASWGHFGCIWGRNMPTAVIYIRPQRYTKSFVDKEARFTLSFFDKQYKKDLAYLGSHSGRDEDKVSKTALTPCFLDGQPAFEEARMVLVCRKVYQAPLLEQGFLDKDVMNEAYPEKDFHDMYVGEIERVWVRGE